VVSFAPWPLYSQGKSSWCPLDRRLGGPQGWSGSSGREKKIHNICSCENVKLRNNKIIIKVKSNIVFVPKDHTVKAYSRAWR
jgi:hypothetical protein